VVLEKVGDQLAQSAEKRIRITNSEEDRNIFACELPSETRYGRKDTGRERGEGKARKKT
jgi:hypothetical protein